MTEAIPFVYEDLLKSGTALTTTEENWVAAKVVKTYGVAVDKREAEDDQDGPDFGKYLIASWISEK